MSMTWKGWSDEECQRLELYAGEETAAQIAARLPGRTTDAVRRKARSLGIPLTIRTGVYVRGRVKNRNYGRKNSIPPEQRPTVKRMINRLGLSKASEKLNLSESTLRAHFG